MRKIIELLEKNSQVSDYKINMCKKESFELFYVKGRLETVRSTDTCDKQVTVYADHDGFKGDAQFAVYPPDTDEKIADKINTAVQNALLINNLNYTLPENEKGEYTLHSNFENESMQQLADSIANAVFSANSVEGGSLNAVEVFVNHYTDTVVNSRGLEKVQHRYDAMVEAIPTFNGERESVELYEQYNFSSMDENALVKEIAEKMNEVKARYEAVRPDFDIDCDIVINRLEMNDLFTAFADDLNYVTVYGNSNLFKKGEKIQKTIEGDPVTIKMKGAVEGNINSASFDSDGMALDEVTLVENGVVKNYYGSNRFGQYLGEKPSGNLGCLCVEGGSVKSLEGKPYLEVLSMSGLQVDFFNNYIGGEIRLAYYHDGKNTIPVTGISMAGRLDDVLCKIGLSEEMAVFDGYTGPAKAVLKGMKIF